MLKVPSLNCSLMILALSFLLTGCGGSGSSDSQVSVTIVAPNSISGKTYRLQTSQGISEVYFYSSNQSFEYRPQNSASQLGNYLSRQNGNRYDVDLTFAMSTGTLQLDFTTESAGQYTLKLPGQNSETGTFNLTQNSTGFSSSGSAGLSMPTITIPSISGNNPPSASMPAH